MNKVLLIVASIISVIGIFLFLIITLFPPLWSLISPRAPRPEIRHGEFSFRLEYEVQGERVIVTDTIIVEHAGTSWNAGFGNHNVWNSRLESDGDEVIELFRSDKDVVFINVLSNLSGNYLLEQSDISHPREGLPPVIRVSLDSENSNSWQEEQILTVFTDDEPANFNAFNGSKWHISPEDLLSEYGIELISWENDPPIENSFK